MSHIGKRTFYPTGRMREYVNEIMESGRISYGEFSRQFEQEFSQIHGCQFGVLSNSGTSSLLVALQAMKELHGWQDGDEVIVPAITFVATVNVVLQLRLKPVLVDVEKPFYGLDTRKIPTVLTEKTRAIMPVHTFGQPCNMQAIRAIANDCYLSVIEDSCESMFVQHQGKPVGAWGDIGCFSTYMAHLIVTGVGGIATTNNPDYARKMRSLVNHGIAGASLDGISFDPSRDFVFESVGHSFRLTEFEAALGLAQLESWEEMIKKRQANACYLSQLLADLGLGKHLQLPVVRPQTGHAWMMYPLVCKKAGVRDKLRQYLAGNEIGTRLMLPLVSQPVYKGLWNPDDYPVARWIDDNGLYLGCHQGLGQAELDYVADKLEAFFR